MGKLDPVEEPGVGGGCRVESEDARSWLCRLPSELCSELLLYKVR